MYKNFLLSIVIFLLQSVISFGQTVYTIETVPNPKELSNTFVCDPDSLLNLTTTYELNILLQKLENKTSDQVAVVVVNSIGDAIPKDFATSLFNKWGIGVKGKDNGLLILVVKDQHRVEFETGYGMEGILTDVECKSIQISYMVPEFKNGNFDKGIMNGVAAISDILQKGESSDYSNQIEINQRSRSIAAYKGFTIIAGIFYIIFLFIYAMYRTSEKVFTDFYGEIKEESSQQLQLPRWKWVIIYFILPPLLISAFYNFYNGEQYVLSLLAMMYLYSMFIVIDRRIRINNYVSSTFLKEDYYGNYLKYKTSHKWQLAEQIIFPVPFLFYYLYYKSKVNKLRNQPRICGDCKSQLIKLTEYQEDPYLLPSQLLEEEIKSVDYDVWHCKQCSQTQVFSYLNSDTRYSQCTKCNTRAVYHQWDRILRNPTYYSHGIGERSYKCKYCGNAYNTPYDIAQLTQSYSSGESSYDSSSSSSGSFGGGSSGGGGAGSSW